MKSLILVGIGAFFGAMARAFISQRMQQMQTKIPYGTVAVNILGSFILGIIYGGVVNKELYSIIGSGFLGSFTTFSTFQLENLQLVLKNEWKKLFLYLVLNLIGAMLFAFIGYKIGFVLLNK